MKQLVTLIRIWQCVIVKQYTHLVEISRNIKSIVVVLVINVWVFMKYCFVKAYLFLLAFHTEKKKKTVKKNPENKNSGIHI